MKRIINLFKTFWRLNWKTKIGILFLIPPIWGVFAFILQIEMFNCFPESNNDFIFSLDVKNTAKASPTIPIYLGLMAIAGAHLIKDNLKKE